VHLPLVLSGRTPAPCPITPQALSWSLACGVASFCSSSSGYQRKALNVEERRQESFTDRERELSLPVSPNVGDCSLYALIHVCEPLGS
jgi:hypothetical protein